MGDAPGYDVFYPASHASRRLGVRSEVQNERPAGGELEREGAIVRVRL